MSSFFPIDYMHGSFFLSDILCAEILKILLRDEVLAPDVDLKWLAKRTELFSGSDLKRMLSRRTSSCN